MFPIFVINLDRSPDRLTFMKEQLDSQGLLFERLPGVNGTDVPAWLKSEFSGRHELTAGEVGCYASHLSAAHAIVARGLPCAVVLEDDVVLDADFGPTVRAAIAAAPDDWDYIHLNTNYKAALVSVASLTDKRTLIKNCRDPVNTASYVLSNSGARKWLKPTKRARPSDLDIRYSWQWGLRVYGVYPAPSVQSGRHLSTIDPDDARKNETRRWEPGFFADTKSHLWSIRQIGLLTYLRARAATILASWHKRRDGRRRVPVINRA